MSDELILAVPSKGRLEQDSANLFAAFGMALKRETSRGYGGTIAGLDNLRVDYVSAGEIADRLATSDVHLGITGEDLLRETIADIENADIENTVQLVAPLGFGQANVVVAVPDGWVDVETMFDLADVAIQFYENHGRPLRVATKYTYLATDFFVKHGVNNVELIQSVGTTERVPNAGLAEVIVDITSTGATLKANDLRVLKDGVILQSEANLVAALKADWSPQVLETAKRLLARLTAYQKAQNYCVVTFYKLPDNFDNLVKDFVSAARRHLRFALPPKFIGEIPKGIIITTENLNDFVALAYQHGLGDVVVTRPDFIFERRNQAFEELKEALEKRAKLEAKP
ncbi:MAG: ATP phosphoribosyltransferase [Parvibaculales bacterium]